LSRRALSSEIGLIASFLVIIFGVPITQICIQSSQRKRVQFTDIFRYAPTEKNLRQFEQGLKSESWFEQKLRPRTQQLLFWTLGDTGSRADMGRDGWLFYRPDVRYIVEPDRPDGGGSEGTWVQPAEGSYRDNVVRAIVRFRDQLRERRIELLVVPVPGKPSIYPDMLWPMANNAGTTPMHDSEEGLHSPTLQLIEKLRSRGVEVVDLFSRFRQARQEHSNDRLYLTQDTHWTPVGARLAAETVAEKLRALGWAPPPTLEFRSRRVRVRRFGDVLEMVEVGGNRGNGPAEEVECTQVVVDTGGVLVSSDSERPGTFRYPAASVSILALGDSFCRIYQNREPRSLGEVVSPTEEVASGDSRAENAPTRLLPGSAGFLSHLALALRLPLDFIVSDGGASTDVRKSLSTNPEILEGKKVVVWEFVERDIRLGKTGWLDVALPPE
jgi:hypothetical protein